MLCSGMMLEGAKWDPDQAMVVDSVLGEMYTPLPDRALHPGGRPRHRADVVRVPHLQDGRAQGRVLSTTGMSTNFVVAVELPTAVVVAEPREVLAGVVGPQLAALREADGRTGRLGGSSVRSAKHCVGGRRRRGALVARAALVLRQGRVIPFLALPTSSAVSLPRHASRTCRIVGAQ